MTQFYVSIMFLGILLVAVSLVMIAYDRKKGHDKAVILEEKQNRLESIVSDAEEMIEELNKFSDYVVSQMDVKNQEMEVHLKRYTGQIEALEERMISGYLKVKEYEETMNIPKRAVNDSVRREGSLKQEFQSRAEVASTRQKENLYKINSDIVMEPAVMESFMSTSVQATKRIAKSVEKVVHLSSRHEKVIEMASSGLSSTEIAKHLNMGKGEIQLILQMNK